MAVPESGGAGKGSNGEAVGSGAVDKHAAVVRRAAGIASVEAKRSATADVRRAAGASGTVGYPDGGGRRDDEPVREELHGSGGDYNDPSKSKRVLGEPHVERALSAVFRGEETHVERVPSEEVFGEADVEQDLGDAVNYLRGDEDYVGREITVDVRCGAHVKVKRAAELPDEVLVEELVGQNDCALTAVFRGEEAYVEPAPGWEVRGEDAAEAYVEPAPGGEVRGENGEEAYVEPALDGEVRGEDGEEVHVEPAPGGEVRREHGEEVHVEPAPGGEVRREHGEEVHVEHVVVLDHEPVEATAGLVLGAPVPAAVRAAVLEARALKNMEGAKAAKEAAKQWANGNQNVANNAFSSAPSKKRRNLAGHKKLSSIQNVGSSVLEFVDIVEINKTFCFQKVEQFRIEEYLTGIEEIDDDLRKLIGLFNQMIPLVKAAQEESLSQEGLSDVNREMKFATYQMRVLRKKINGKGGKAPIIPPQFLERYC
uniref:Uncharacterized protein n=1 Tax=Oryza nivara TaxID=4536 RepID=A0A0E0J461_ORYNI